MYYIRRVIITLSIISFVSVSSLVIVRAGEAIAMPHKVTKLRVIDTTSTTVTLKWKDQTDAKKYRIRVMNSDGSLLKKITTTKHKRKVKGLQPDTVYKFKVRAKSGKHFGAFSKTVTARTQDVAQDTSQLLIGFWGLNGFITEAGLADVSSRFNTSVFQVASSAPNYTVQTLLPLVRESGMKVTLRMTGDHSEYTTDGNFDLEKWKTDLSDWENSGVQEFIDDGTLVGHMLLDDIDTFAGTNPTASDLDEMARYSKEIMPGLMTFVRQKCSNLPEPTTESGEYEYVDNCVNQYTNYQGFSDGPIDEYIAEQTAAAEQYNLGMINGLNIADGGDGSSGQVGWSAGKYAMSAEEITSYGEALLSVPDIQMFLMWEYDGEELWSDGVTIGSDYFDQPELQAALAAFGESITQ